MSDDAADFAAFAATLNVVTPDAPAPEAAPADVAVTPAEGASTDTPKAEAPPPPAEAKPEPTPEPKTDWAAVAAKERARREARQQSRQQAAATAAALEAAQAKAAMLDELQTLAKSDRLAALEKLGLDISEVNHDYVDRLDKNPNAPTAAQKAEADRLARIEARQDAIDAANAKAKADADAASKKERIATAHRELTEQTTKVIKENIEEFDTLSRHKKGPEIVISLLVGHHRQYGKDLDIKEACRQVEAHLAEEMKPFAGAKALAAPEAKTTTLSGDMRQADLRQSQETDENKEFLSTALRLLKQSA